MALIACSECNTKVSDKAANCVSCGAPIETLKESKGSGTTLYTTQETSKRLKMHQLIAWGMVILGIIFIYNASNGTEPPSDGLMTLGSLSLLIGIIWAAVTRFRIWWHHK